MDNETNMTTETAAGNTAQGENEQVGQNGDQTAKGGNQQYVPYSRFQEVNAKYKDLEGKYDQVSEMLNKMKGALGQDNGSKSFKLDYNNPDKSIEDYFNAKLEERANAMKTDQAQKETQLQRASAIKWFREQPDYSEELEEKAARFITENELHGMDPHKAVALAYKFITMGDGSGYVRNQKEGLTKPGAGGKTKAMDIKAQIEALDPKDEKFDDKMKVLQAKLAV